MSSFGKIWNDPTESSDTIESLNVFCNKLQKKREIYIYNKKSKQTQIYNRFFTYNTDYTIERKKFKNQNILISQKIILKYTFFFVNIRST